MNHSWEKEGIYIGGWKMGYENNESLADVIELIFFV